MNPRDSSLVTSLYITEASNMRAFARRRLDDAEEAEDLVNEAFRILSERDDLEEIRNPAAFLMTVLDRQINTHLRKKYRRICLPIEQVETDIPSAPDIAESFEEKEQAALVAESLKEIRSPRQKRAVNFYSLNYKASEIAAMETAAGQPTTSHQISCVLQRGFANLKVQFRRKGLVPSFLPAPWLLRIRARISAGFHHFTENHRLLDATAALQIVMVVSVATIFKPVPPKAAVPNGTSPPAPVSEEAGLELAKWVSPPPGPARALILSPVNQAADRRREQPGALTSPTGAPAPLTASALTSGHGGPGEIPVQMQPAPRAEVSSDPERSQASVELDRYYSITEYDLPQPGSREAQSFYDQAVDVGNNPDEVPRPQCGGLPPICDDDPPSHYE